MARRSVVYETDAKSLIHCITKFEEEEENFQLCLQFVLSNFLYHNFLDVDSHKITRTIQGMRDKFFIHSQKDRADTFQTLVDDFLDTTAFEGRDHGKTDTHYRILSLLLTLSEAPTHVQYKKTVKKEEEIEEEEFDWAAHLLEGEERYTCSYEDSDDSLSSDDEEGSGILEDRAPSVQPPLLQPRPPEELIADITVAEADEPVARESQWLRNNLVNPYWAGTAGSGYSAHRSASLNHTWQEHLGNMSPLLGGETANITEHQVMRELLWMLMGSERTHIFRWHGSGYMVNPDLQLSHITHESLASLLEKFCHYGSIVQCLQRYVEDVAMGGCHGSDAGGVEFPQTYQAFADVLCSYICGFEKELTVIEKEIQAQAETWTTLKLSEHLSSRLTELDILDHVYRDGIAPWWEEGNCATQAAQLLAVLYETLLQCHNMGDMAEPLTCMLLPMWIRTSKPYWDIVDQWIYSGTLNDPREEFIIKRNKEACSLDETFWDAAFTIHINTQDTSADSSSSAGPPDQADQSRFTHQLSLPTFLAPVLEQIVLTGKSMEMLQNLSCPDIRHQLGHGRKTLYNTFIQLLECHLGTTRSTASRPIAMIARQQHLSSAVFVDNISQQMTIKGIQDPLLSLNFGQIFDPHTFYAAPLTEEDDQINSRIEQLHVSGLKPIQLCLERCLYPQIQQRYREVCSTLLTILKDNYHIMEAFAAMRRYFLMESGDVMYEFYMEIFKKLQLHEPWQDASFLNVVMQEAILIRHADDVEKVSVSVSTPTKKRTPQPITLLDGLTLHYQVTWPVDVILNSKCMSIYNKIFTFLLQIKRAKQSMESLRFADLENQPLQSSLDRQEALLSFTPTEHVPQKQLIHRMHLLRMKLMHFVNSLHNYIMTRILHSTCLDFQSSVEEANDLEELLRTHHRYLSTIYARCLLHPNVQLVKETVAKVLNLAITFHKAWNEGIHAMSTKTLSNMEGEFSMSLKFLASFFNNIIKRGSFPHLESLAFALVTSSEQMTR